MEAAHKHGGALLLGQAPPGLEIRACGRASRPTGSWCQGGTQGEERGSCVLERASTSISKQPAECRRHAGCTATLEAAAAPQSLQTSGPPGNKAEEAVGYVSTRSVKLQRSFPLSEVVGLDNIKQALLLGAVDTGEAWICGVGQG